MKLPVVSSDQSNLTYFYSSFGLYFCVKLFVSAVTQKFPIMLLGFGASPIIEYFVALIWLGIVRRTRSENVSAEYFTPIKPNSSVVTK